MRSAWLACLLAALPGSAGALPRVALAVDGTDSLNGPALAALAGALRAEAAVSVFVLSGETMRNPIERGRLVASLESRDVVVAVGDEAAGFVTRELEDARVYFVGAGVVAGASLASGRVAGLFSYNVDALLDAVRVLTPGTLGFAYTPGYEPVAAWVRAGAASRGLKLLERRVESVRDVTPAIRELVERAGAVWVVGDPLLVRGAGFEFLRELSLSRRVPVVAAGPGDVRRGAYLAFEPEEGALVSRAAELLVAALRGAKAGLQPATAGGLAYNGVLSEKWRLAPGAKWRPIR